MFSHFKATRRESAKNKSSTPPTAGKQALKNHSSAISKQQEKEIVVNKTFKRPTRKRSKRNTKENHWYMTNPKQSERGTEKNPWAMDNPNYKFGKSLLSDGDLKRAAPFTRKLHKFYMQRGKSDDDSHIMVALRPETSAWPPRWSNGLLTLCFFLTNRNMTEKLRRRALQLASLILNSFARQR
jgi:hypothetical protein